MKKNMPIILCSIILFCTACEKAVDPIDKYDNITANSSIEELKEVHKGDIISEEGETGFIAIGKNTVLNFIAEKYNTENPSTFIEHPDTHLSISVSVKCPEMTNQDIKTLLDMFQKKFGDYECFEEKENTKDNIYFFNYESNQKIEIMYFNDKIHVKYTFL